MDDPGQLALILEHPEPCKGPHRTPRYMVSLVGMIYDCGCARASAGHIDHPTRRLVTTSSRSARLLVPTQMELHRVLDEVHRDEMIRISEPD